MVESDSKVTVQKHKKRKIPIVHSSDDSEEKKSDIEEEKRKKTTLVESDRDAIPKNGPK